MRLSVIGCGYLGAVHAAAMASIGHEVVGIDINQRKIDALSKGDAPFFEPGLQEILTSGIASGKLRFTTDMSAAKGAKVHFIAVGTPQRRDGYAADLTSVHAAVDGLLPHLSDGDIVAGKSTVPVGTAADLATREELGRGESVAFLREMDEINMRRRNRAVQLVVDALGGSVFQKKVTVLGAAFKPHSDDIRDSPALDVAVRLHGLGASMTVTDPAAIENARRVHPQLTYVEDRDGALRDADAVIVVTEWDEYRRQLAPEYAASLTSGRVIVDGRNCLDAAAWRAAGWHYAGMGRP